MAKGHVKPKYQSSKSDEHLLAKMTALTSADDPNDEPTRAALAEMQSLFTPPHVSEQDRFALAEMIALTRTDSAVGSGTAEALAEMQRLSGPNTAITARSGDADAAALAEFEALITPEQKKPLVAGGDADYPEPRYGVQVERAIYQSQIDLVNAFRASPRKRRRDYGYDR